MAKKKKKASTPTTNTFVDPPEQGSVITFHVNQYGEQVSLTCRDMYYGDVVRAFRHFSLGMGFQPETVNQWLGEPD